jgi:hypothetical protein
VNTYDDAGFLSVRLGSRLQETPSELRFRALLTEGGAEPRRLVEDVRLVRRSG